MFGVQARAGDLAGAPARGGGPDAERLRQLEQRGLDPGGDVQDTLGVGVCSGQEGTGGVADVQLVTGLLSVSEDGRHAALARAAAEKIPRRRNSPCGSWRGP